MTRKPVSLDKPILRQPDIITASEILIRTGNLDKSNHGGKREGAGRKATYPEPCKRVSIPLSLIPQIMAILEAHKPQ